MKSLNTTIKINNRTKTKIERLKLHEKESYNDVIVRLIKSRNDELDAITIRNIRKSLDDIKKGRVQFLSQIEKETTHKRK